MTIRNEADQPFSSWKPADKFAYKLRERHMAIEKHVVPEYRFDPKRRWRLDFAWPTLKVAVEIDGFGYGHQSQQGMVQDNEKANRAVEMGWRVFRYNSWDMAKISRVEEAVDQVCGFIYEVRE